MRSPPIVAGCNDRVVPLEGPAYESQTRERSGYEESQRSDDPQATMRYAFKRTVYSNDDVVGLHKNGKSVLAIKFRHDRFLDQPWPIDVLIAHRVVAGAPQSIVQVKDPEGVMWIES